jgi:hypothetical protein
MMVLIFLQIACGLQSQTTSDAEINTPTHILTTVTLTEEPTHTPTKPPTSTPTIIVPTPTLHFGIPTPISGKGVLIGKIQWNSLPAVKSQVKLCSDFDGYYGCQGLEYSASTDEEGYYLIENVKPDDYTLLANLFGSSWYLYYREEINVKAEQVKFAETFNLYKLDLKPISPLQNKNIDLANDDPTLTWQEYPDAAYYELEVDTYFENPAITKKLESTQYTLDDEILLIDCPYSWSVSAYNKDGYIISKFEEEVKFNLINSGVSCKITNLVPTDSAKLIEGQAQLSWDAHPLADYYVVYVTTQDNSFSIIMNEGGTKIESGTIFDISNLPAGTYVWSIDGFDTSNNQVATSGLIYFSIISP